MKVVKIGTRRSALALRQTQLVVSSLRSAYPEISFLVVPLQTTGDMRRDKLGMSVQDKKQWVIDIEKQITGKDIDFAVHSAKDVPLDLEIGTEIKPVLHRVSPNDVLIYKATDQTVDAPIPQIAAGAMIGTSSKRRRAQLLKLRPDLCVQPCRGNINTRIEKLFSGDQFDGIIIAKAGLERMNSLDGLSYIELPVESFVPAIGQGSLLAQYRSNDSEISELLSRVSEADETWVYKAEHASISALGADCHSSVGCFADIVDEELRLRVRVLSIDGSECIEEVVRGPKEEAERMGSQVGKLLLSKGAASLL